MKLNVASRKKVSRNLGNIYLSNPASTSGRRKVSNNNITTQNANTTRSPDCKRSSIFQSDEIASVVMRKSDGGTKQNNALVKKPSKVLSAKIAGKSKKGKNFILENKLKVKKMSSENKSQVDGSNPNNFPQNVRNNNSTIQY